MVMPKGFKRLTQRNFLELDKENFESQYFKMHKLNISIINWKL